LHTEQHALDLDLSLMQPADPGAPVIEAAAR